MLPGVSLLGFKSGRDVFTDLLNRAAGPQFSGNLHGHDLGRIRPALDRGFLIHVPFDRAVGEAERTDTIVVGLRLYPLPRVPARRP